jgi:hypothetical protein
MAFDLTGIGSIADLAKGLVDRFLPPAATEQEKLAAQMQLQQMLEARENAVLDTQKAVMTAEMQQGDNYTKRARPSIVYFGLIAIGLVHVLLPIIAWIVLKLTASPLTDMPDIKLPPQFWVTWGGVCSVWILGRSAERRGATGKIVGMITGAK